MSNDQPPKKRIHRKRRPAQDSERKSTPLILYLALAGGIGVVVTVGVLIVVLSSQNAETLAPLESLVAEEPNGSGGSDSNEEHIASADENQDLAPDFEKTIGLRLDQIVERLSRPDVGLIFSSSEPVDGETATLGESITKDARANLIGDPANLYSVTMTQGFVGAGPDATLVDTVLFEALFEVTSSTWDEGYKTFRAALEEATSTGGAVLTNNGKSYVVRWVSPLLMVGVYEEQEGLKVAKAMGLTSGGE